MAKREIIHLGFFVKYYIVIGHKKGELGNIYNCDWIEYIARNDQYHFDDTPPGAHQLFGYLDVNFNESPQYGKRATKTQEAWLIGRHRIARVVDFGNCGYQFVRKNSTYRIQFPEKIVISFDKAIADNYVNNPSNDMGRIDIELTDLNDQIINCYDNKCTIDPVIFKLVQFDNYGDAYVDIQHEEKLADFLAHIAKFVNFLTHYPNSAIYLVCKKEQEGEIKKFLRQKIEAEHLTNYFEFCNETFQRRAPKRGLKSGEPESEYDTFKETIDEFFNENTFSADLENNERNFYSVPFKKSKITINNNWSVHTNSEKFKNFLKYNPAITLEIVGNLREDDVVQFIVANQIKANLFLTNEPNNQLIKAAIAQNRKAEIQQQAHESQYDTLKFIPERYQEHDQYRPAIQRYIPQKLGLVDAQQQNTNMRTGQNQNNSQNNSTNAQRGINNVFVVKENPIKIEISSKSSIPDVKFKLCKDSIERLIGLKFENEENIPQTEANIDSIFTSMGKIIHSSVASRDCYCPLSYNVDELIAGAFYVPKTKLDQIYHPKFDSNFECRDTLFFAPPYGAIAIKKDIYSFKLHVRPFDKSACEKILNHSLQHDDFVKSLIEDYSSEQIKTRVIEALNRLFLKRDIAGVSLLTKSLYSLKLRNPSIYYTLIDHYLLTSGDFSEFVDNPRFIATFDGLGHLKDKKKTAWWNKIVAIQSHNNFHFDLNHLYMQFNCFWQDLEALQRFLSIPQEFPFHDFADAGIALGKIYRIMAKTRNPFDQIKRFAEGNISHAYMLFDLFNASMYCSEMDIYCKKLIEQLNAEEVFDKNVLRHAYFSIEKLYQLATQNVPLEVLESYLFVFAAVNGNTSHNHSDVEFYRHLFATIKTELTQNNIIDPQKVKFIYATIMLFAAYGNNATKEKTAEDIRAFLGQNHAIKKCENILSCYNTVQYSDFFAECEINHHMKHSHLMLAFHTIAAVSQNGQYQEIIEQSNELIIANSSLSPALQKIMKDLCVHGELINILRRFVGQMTLLSEGADDKKANLIKSIILVGYALNPISDFQISFKRLNQSLNTLSIESLENLNKLFLDIDFKKSLLMHALLEKEDLFLVFCQQVSQVNCFDDLIFLTQEFNIPLLTIKASENSLLFKIKQFESQNQAEWYGLDVKHYALNYEKYIKTLLEKKYIEQSHQDKINQFQQKFVEKIYLSCNLGDSEYPFNTKFIKNSYEKLVEIIGTAEQDDLLQIAQILETFYITKIGESIDPCHLLDVVNSLLKHIDSIENIVDFLTEISRNVWQDGDKKVKYLKDIFSKIKDFSSCYKKNNLMAKLNQNTVNQIKSCMELIKKITHVEELNLNDLKQNVLSKITVQQYLQFIEKLTLLANITSERVKTNFTEINKNLYNLLTKYTDIFTDLLDIATFNIELLDNIQFVDKNEIRLIAKICKNELQLNAKNPETNSKLIFTQQLKDLLHKQLDVLSLEHFYDKKQLSCPSVAVLNKLLDRYEDDIESALHHYEKDPRFTRPHKKADINGNNRTTHKEDEYQTGKFNFNTVRQNELVDLITEKYQDFEKSTRRNLLFSLLYYINNMGYRLPTFDNKDQKTPVRKLSDVALQQAFNHIKAEMAQCRLEKQNDIWQNKKYQRSVCKLLVIIREAIFRYEGKNAYSTQMSAILLAILAGDYNYAMQINTGEGKALISIFIAVALQTMTDKQIVLTTSNLNLSFRDSEAYDQLIDWFGIEHAHIAATTKNKLVLEKAKIIYTTGHDFALCHGKNLPINNSNRIYLNDECDYTKLHLTPAINSQPKQNEQDNWWIYEEILAYIQALNQPESKKNSEQQTQGLVEQLKEKFYVTIQELQVEKMQKLTEISNNIEIALHLRDAYIQKIGKTFDDQIDICNKRLMKLNEQTIHVQFDTLIDSAIVANYVLKKGSSYEVVDYSENGKKVKHVVPVEGGKPITEGDVMYMYGVHQFLIQKTILEYRQHNEYSEFRKPSALESTTYFNNYSTQAGCKAIGVTGTVPKEKYKIYAAFIGHGKSDVIPPHQKSNRIDAVQYEDLKHVKEGSHHVCNTENILIDKLAQRIQNHVGPALIYCRDKNECEARAQALLNKFEGLGYTIQLVINGITADFTDGDRLTELGRQAQKKKTITLTVGDGRGIDIAPEGEDGLLTICAFVPETVEKILQIFGRSGRNGKVGATDLLILVDELTKYGIRFSDLAKEFEFLDEIKSREFAFAIEKIGFIQYEIQKNIGDETQKKEMIAYMDNLYNKLLLKKVAQKIKDNRGNQINEHLISGSWEPFIILGIDELDAIYQEFCDRSEVMLKTIGLNINIKQITKKKERYMQQAEAAIRQEIEIQQGSDQHYIQDRIERSVKKVADRMNVILNLQQTFIKNKQKNIAALLDVIKIQYMDIPYMKLKNMISQRYDNVLIDDSISEEQAMVMINHNVRSDLARIQEGQEGVDACKKQVLGNTFNQNLSELDKTVKLMQKYVNAHIGFYGDSSIDISRECNAIYLQFENKRQLIEKYKQTQLIEFNKYLILTACQKSIDLIIRNDVSEREKIEQLMLHLQIIQTYQTMRDEGSGQLYFEKYLIKYIQDVQQSIPEILEYYKQSLNKKITANFHDWELEIEAEKAKKYQQEINQLRNKYVNPDIENIIQNLQDVDYTQSENQHHYDNILESIDAYIYKKEADKFIANYLITQKTVISTCQIAYKELRLAISENLNFLSNTEIKTEDSNGLIEMNSLIQMATKEQKNTLKFKEIINETIKKINRIICKYNEDVAQLKEVNEEQFKYQELPTIEVDKIDDGLNINNIYHITRENGETISRKLDYLNYQKSQRNSFFRSLKEEDAQSFLSTMVDFYNDYDDGEDIQEEYVVENLLGS